MEGGRLYGTLKKPRLILTNSSAVTKKMNIGDSGQLLIRGIIEKERKEELPDYRELIFKTIKVNDAEILQNRTMRIAV